MPSRRGILQLLGATGTVGAIAGCAGSDGGSANDDGNSEQLPTEGGSGEESPTGSGQSSNGGGDLGRSVTFAGDPGELTITPVEARLTDYVIGLDENTSTRRELASRGPSGGTAGSDGTTLFFLLKLRLEYAGSEPIGYPQYGFGFESADGAQYDRVALERDDGVSYNLPLPRRPPAELSPDTDTEVWIVFPVSASTTAGTLTADLEIQGFLELEPREWALNLEGIDPDTYDFGELAVGESATIGNSNIGLAFTARETRTETGSFDYPYSGDTYTADPPPEGEKYVLVDIGVENVGAEGVVSPPLGEMRLSGSDWETGALSYQGDDAYNRGDRTTVDAGTTKSGYVLFSVPADAEQSTFSIAVTSDITVSWRISGSG
jgi:hypothetical protein